MAQEAPTAQAEADVALMRELLPDDEVGGPAPEPAVRGESVPGQSTASMAPLQDLLYEEELLRNPYALKMWVRYLDARKNASTKKRYLLFERALKSLPGSYKVRASPPGDDGARRCRAGSQAQPASCVDGGGGGLGPSLPSHPCSPPDARPRSSGTPTCWSAARRCAACRPRTRA